MTHLLILDSQQQNLLHDRQTGHLSTNLGLFSRILLQVPTGPHYVAVLLGAFMAGIVPSTLHALGDSGAGALLDREALARGLSADTVLRRRVGHPCEVVPDGDSLRLLLGDRVLRVPARLREAVDVVASAPRLAPRDLPLDPESALVLCRRLVREGLLEVVR